MINRLFFLYNLATILVSLSLAGQTLSSLCESLAGETRYFYHNQGTPPEAEANLNVINTDL